MLKPWLIKITTSESATVVIWANSRSEVEDAAYNVDISRLCTEPEDTQVNILGMADGEDVAENDNFNTDGEEYTGHVCEICGDAIDEGFTNGDGDVCVCSACFEEYMDGTFGKHKWMEVADDGCDGYYIVASGTSIGGYHGTGIYFTAWGS